MTTYKKIKTIEVFGVKKQIYNKDKSKKDYVTYKGEKIELEKYKKIMLKLKKSKKSIKGTNGGALKIGNGDKRDEILEMIFKLIDDDNEKYINEKLKELKDRIDKNEFYKISIRNYLELPHETEDARPLFNKQDDVEKDISKIFILMSLRVKDNPNYNWENYFENYNSIVKKYEDLFDNT